MDSMCATKGLLIAVLFFPLACNKAPAQIGSGAEGQGTVIRWPWSGPDTVNVQAYGVLLESGLITDPPGPVERAWLKRQGCTLSHIAFDESGTETLEEAGGVTTAEGEPIFMARRVYVCP